MLRVMFGLLAIDKPPGPTSHDVVAVVRRRLGRGVKVGHAGTLDPFARGVLVVCVGPATRLADYVQAQPKRYRAVVRLGATSTTDDPEGEIEPNPDIAAPAEDGVRQAVAAFVGHIEQIPPAHSAVHVDGRRAYKLARAGKDVRLPARPVVVHAIDVLDYRWPELEIGVRCGSGTYIRSLARDIGSALNAGGYCRALTRTAVGAFELDRAVAPDDLDPARDLLPPTLALGDMPRAVLEDDQLAALRNGRVVDLSEPAAAGATEIALLDATGNLLAIAEPRATGQKAQPVKVFVVG
jgi:tRNA pseudouridine55 synthase